MKHPLKKVILTGLALLTMGLAGCSTNNQQSNSSSQQAESVSNKNITSSEQLASLNYQSGQPAYIDVDNGKSTLNKNDWKQVHVDYANLDQLNRTSVGNTAYLDQRNVANSSLRQSQTFKPTAWHQKFVNGTAIINRGHLIAYSLSKGVAMTGDYNPNSQSGDQDNPKNLFTQTAFSNQKVQTIFETKVRDALKDGKKVIYQVKPIFQGDDLMAKGVQMQAISTDGSLNFNVYLFNVQPGVKFNYANGRSTIDNNMEVPTPEGAPTFNDNKNAQEGDRRGNMIYHNHHWVRDYLIYRGAKHVIDKHYENKRYREYSHRESFHSYRNHEHFSFRHRR